MAPQKDRHGYKATSVRFPFGLLQWIKGESERTGRSVSAVIIGAVERERDHAAPSISAGSGSPDAIDRT